MKKSQQGAAVAVVAIGLIVLAVGATILISQLLEERTARQRLEREAAELRREVEMLKMVPRLQTTERYYRLSASRERSVSFAADALELSR